MTKLEVIIQPSKFEPVKEVLMELGVQGMTILEVRDMDGKKVTRRRIEAAIQCGSPAKIKIELVIPDELVESAVDAIIKTAFTGKIGDGKIFLSKIDEAIRIRNQERGAAAI